jgi:hypothetical protein
VLSKLWKLWKQFGQLVGDFIARIVLTVFYFTILMPFGLAVRWFQDPLGLKPGSVASFWLKREARETNLSEARREF